MKFLTTIFIFCLMVFSAFSQSSKPKTNPSKPKPGATPQKRADEKAEFIKAGAVTDAVERIAALRKFVEAFPNSPQKPDAYGLIVTADAELGYGKLKADDVAGAVELFKTAAKDAPKPVPDPLFTETLSKFPVNLYFRGARSEALEVAKTLEEKADASPSQLLILASFYMMIENGAEAKRLANAAIALQPNSAAYQTLGLANRIDFQLDDSAAAYAKALELDPESLSARRGLAEMKRSLGKADEAAELYREIIAKDENNLPARTGLILSLFDVGKRTEAETEMSKTLETSPNNVILLGGAAYWYAAHNDGEKAVEYANKAIAIDPRFIWSHIALARGLVLQKNPLDAERTLFAARRYGNFPTLDYEIASAQVAGGFYREASETLSKSFVIKDDGIVHTYLGGRVDKGSANLIELMSYEREASIFAATAADDPQNAARLRSLLDLMQQLDSATPKPDAVSAAVDGFVLGDDQLKIHRQLFAASQLLDKKVAFGKVLELTKAASGNTDAGLDFPTAASAVMANELYKSRAIAYTRGEYIRSPDVPRSTLSAILRGRIEEITGWALYETNNPTESVIHLRRAVSVMPADSVYWRSSMWRLGSALMLAGKDAETLDTYIKCYRPGDQDAAKFAVIETLYRRVNGNTDDLEKKIGPNPAVNETVAQKIDPNPTPEPTPVIKPLPTPMPTIPPVVPIMEDPKPTPTPELKVEITPTPTPEVKAEPTPASTPPTDIPVKPEPTPEPTATPDTAKRDAVPETVPTPTPQATPEPQKITDEKSVSVTKSANTTKDLFPPVVILIPKPETAKTDKDAKIEPSPTPSETKTVEEPKPTPSSTPEKKPDETTVADSSLPHVVVSGTDEIKPCTIKTSAETLTLRNTGGNLVILVGVDGDADLKELTASSSSPTDISIRPDPDITVKRRSLFLVRSISTRVGVYQLTFALPCGKKDVIVNVR